MVTSVLRDAVLILGSVASGNDLAVRRSGPPKGVRVGDKKPEREASRRSLPADQATNKKGFSPSWSGLALWLRQAKTGDGQLGLFPAQDLQRLHQL